mgnify:CR=1 FL=1
MKLDDKKNPYKEGTVMYSMLEILKDLKWHCSQHEFPSSQPAKPLQIMRQHGFQFEKSGQNWEKRMFCKICNKTTPHRRLISLERKGIDITRGNFPERLKQRIREYYQNKDEIMGSSITGRTAEVDHRIPQIRWIAKEQNYDVDMPNEEIEKRFMILSRENNLLKSRFCERCVKTGKRQGLLGIKFFFNGDDEYTDEIGCIGCGWHNPKKWKEELNKKLGK